jgi:hypothetical protein
MKAPMYKVIICKENNNEGNASASQKECQRMQDCANVYMQMHTWSANTGEVLGLSSKREVFPAQ